MANPEIPQYRESVNISAPGVMDTTSGIRQTPSYAQAGLGVVDKFLNNELGNIMGDLGAKAGAQQGKDFESLPEITPEMAKYNQAALPIASQVAVNGMQNDAESYYRQLMANGLTPDSAMIFKAQMASTVQGYSDTIDPKMAPNLTKAGVQIGQSYLNRLNQQMDTLQKNQGMFNFLHNLDENSSSLGSAAFEAGADARADKPITSGGKNVAQLYANGTNQASTAWAAMNISPEAKERMLQNNAFSLVSNSYAGETSQISKKILSDIQQNISPALDFARLNALHDDVVTNPQNKKFGLSMQENQRIQSQIASAQKSLKTSLNLTLPSGSRMSKEIIDRVWQGGPSASQSELSTIMGTSNGQEYLNDVEANKQAYDYAQNLIKNSNQGARNEAIKSIGLNQLKDIFPKNSDLSSISKQMAAGKVKTQLSNFNELMRNNPYEALSQQIPPEVHSSLYMNGASSDDRKQYLNMLSSPQSLIESVPSSGAIALWREAQKNTHLQAQTQNIDPATIGAMPNAQAQQIVGVITAAPIKDKMQYMANLHATAGPYYPNVLNSLIKNGMRRDTAVLVNGANSGINPNVVSEAAEGIQMQVDATDKTEKSDYEKQKNSFMNSLSGLSTSYQNMLNMMPPEQADTYKKLMWDLYAKRTRDISPVTGVDDLAKAIIPFSAEQTNNGKVLIPNVISTVGPKNSLSQRNVSSEDKRNIINQLNMMTQNIDLSSLDTTFLRQNFPIKNPTDDTLKQYIKSNGVWKSKGGSAYLTIAGQPLVTKSGSLYGMYYNN